MTQQFQPKWLLFWWAIACFWYASWLFPVTSDIWQAIDDWVFFTLNGSLASGEYWQAFWAIANWRPFDLVAAGIMTGLSLIWVYQHPSKERIALIAGLCALLLIILLTRGSAALLLQLTDYQRYSPSIVLEPSFRLNAMMDWIETKDYHKDSFPGDHGYVILSTIVFFFVKAGKHWGLVMLCVLSPFMIPRLVSGAHWLTDITIGSLTMTIVSMALLLLTPVHYWLSKPFVTMGNYLPMGIKKITGLT